MPRPSRRLVGGRSLLIGLAVAAAGLIAARVAQRMSSAPVPVYGFEIARVFPHDSKAFTQGILYDQGFLYESTGLEGASTLRKVDLETGKVLRIRALSSQYFGEGLALWDGRLIQLTWRSHRAFVYEKDTFRPAGEFRYETEGWGLTHDGRRLILSDGTERLHFLDPRTFKELRTLRVTDQGLAISHLNELEYVRGEIYANVWRTDRIARISPETGKVRAWIDLAGLLAPEDARAGPADVLTGIAYDEKHDRLFVTGKFWPKLFEIRLVRK